MKDELIWKSDVLKALDMIDAESELFDTIGDAEIYLNNMRSLYNKLVDISSVISVNREN